LTVSGVTTLDAGVYQCAVTTGFNSVESAGATLSMLPVVPADLDQDCDVDQDDVTTFESCAGGPGVPYPADCPLPFDGHDPVAADFDADLDVDQADFGALQRCLSGANVPPDPDCGG